LVPGFSLQSLTLQQGASSIASFNAALAVTIVKKSFQLFFGKLNTKPF
jgi:hypothetical protein